MTYPKASSQSGSAPQDPSQDAAANAQQGAAFGVPSSPRFPEIEQRILDYWAADGTFQASVDNRPAGENGANEFVFYDGPPFANGLPHYGHLLTGYVKDLVPRYQTMRGKHVERRFGWDTHGLPAELEAQRQLGLKTKQDILDLGVETFNKAARESVLRYTKEWEEYVTRQARWVDFENDYKTLNPSYMESVIWAFKQLYDKGLVYEGFRILPYCWNDETPLSNHELRMDDDVYQQRQDPAVTVALPSQTADGTETGEHLVIWTTTPWTLPSNMGISVNPDIDYVAVAENEDGSGRRFVFAEARLQAYARELAGDPKADLSGRIVARYKGSDLVGRRYTPPFSYYLGAEKAHVVLAADYVTTEDGTGLVHMAPAFGEEDKAVLDAAGIETVVPVGPDGKFTSKCPEYQGLLVFDANKPVIDHLKARTRGESDPALVGATTDDVVLVRQESYEHSYPHCWRCRQPLIYMAVSSWFVEVTAIKDRMVELNQQITWVPENVKDGQFGKWLENARDWSISRNRFWGSPIPVWRSDDPNYPRIDVYGSFEQLEADFGEKVTDLHRPFIDELVRPNPDDPRPEGERSMMRRVPDVLDVWFDSGSMSFAQVHYPFENADWFEHHFPADFIVEYIGQTRGWFYTLHILATALFDRPAFSACISHGIVLGNDGQKMSKSLRNYPDVTEVFDRDGADAMRWFLMSSPILRGGNLIVTEEGIRDGVRQALLPLWSTWYFFSLYANAVTRGGEGDGEGGQGYDAQWSTASPDVLDRYLLATLRELVDGVTTSLDELDIAGACDRVRTFLDVLTNWYVRRSRERFWDSGESGDAGGAAGGAADDVAHAFNTLYTTLEVLTRVTAPLLPMVSEEIWRGLTGGRSVHLADWPEASDLPQDHDLVARMDAVRDICSAASALRKAGGLRTRLPLAELTVVTDNAAWLEEFTGIIRDEVNVKQVTLVDLAETDAASFGITRKLVVNARAAGPRLGKDVQRAIKGSKSGDWSVEADGTVVAGGLALVEGEYTLETVVDSAATSGGAGSNGATQASKASGTLASGGFIVLDTSVTPELEQEGLARDVIRVVQQARRSAGLDVSDRISLTVLGDEAIWQATLAHQGLIMSETLATQFGSAADLTALPDNPGVTEKISDGRTVRVIVAKR